MQILLYSKSMKKETQLFNTRQEMSSDTFEIFHYKDARFQEVPIHHHDFYEIYLFINGQVDYRIETEIYHLKPGDLLFFPPGIFHQPLVSPNKPYERIVLWISEKHMNSLVLDDDIQNDFIKKKHIINIANRYEVIYGIFGSLIEDRKNIDKYSDIYARNMLSLSFIEFDRLSKSQSSIKAIKDTNPTVTNILSYINDNFYEDLTLDNIANTFYLNKYYLSHLFSNEVGTSIYRYILKKRIIYAHELLESGYEPSSACMKSGFKEYTNFLKAYKEEYGVTPKYHYIKN